ncbi:MAG TPA: site-specific recombinase [Streptosporangiaceae bacterium]|nr:site-specific recombinase [Streptosporangiaceae bacterium]
MRSLTTGCPAPGGAACAPVEFVAAAERFLAQSTLGEASRRVYRISLSGWTWPLVGMPTPVDRQRRRATPPIVPLAVLDDPRTSARLAAALADRAAVADARTINRELSALRSAVAWWLSQRWIETDPTAGLRPTGEVPAMSSPLTRDQVTRLVRATASLREHAFWQLLYESGAPAREVLSLNIGQLDLTRHQTRARAGSSQARPIRWRPGTSQLLRWLLAGRMDGPVFLTDRRAPSGTPAADLCPVTGRTRLSYRRAAEIFTAATRPLDPTGHGWTLHQLSHTRSRTTASDTVAG